jgi:hypothetical protein
MVTKHHLDVLTPDDAEAFVRDGYVVVRQAFARSTAEGLLEQVWARLPEDRADRSTWTRPHVQIEEVIRDGPVGQIFTPRFNASVNELVGRGRWTTRHGFGWVILRFPGFRRPPWRPPESGWHVDGIDHQHHLTSPETGLVGLEMLTDTEPGGGGTTVRVGSHLVVARRLRDAEPAGISYLELRPFSESLGDLPAIEVTGQAGDVLWMHPFLVHARGPNTGTSIRIAANRCIALHRPMDPDRDDPSLVEQAIRIALAAHHGSSRPR